MFNKLFSTFVPKLDLLLDHYKTFTASYVIKRAGLQNIVPPHQDWSFVDEREFCSATVWVPLMDVNKNNGALGVIPGSHRLLNYPCSSPSHKPSILSDHAFTLFPFVEIVDMKAGEALIFDNRLVHALRPTHRYFALLLVLASRKKQLSYCTIIRYPAPKKELRYMPWIKPFPTLQQ